MAKKWWQEAENWAMLEEEAMKQAMNKPLLTPRMFDVVTIGEVLIDFVGQQKNVSLNQVAGFHRAAGGGPANVAVGVSRLGGRAGFVGKVGQDAFGTYLASVLEKSGVDIRGLVYDEYAHTTLAFVALNQQSIPDFAFFRQGTADTRLTAAELNQDMLTSTHLLHFSSVSLTVESVRSATQEAVRKAREAGAAVSFDPNLRLSLWQDAAAARVDLREAVRQATLVKMNEDELKFITGEENISQGVRRLLGWGPTLVAVTRGEHGAVLGHKGVLLEIPAFPMSVVDTTGAGDAFMAGLLVAVTSSFLTGDKPMFPDEESLYRAGIFASAAAALTCRRPGAMPALPALEDVNGFLRTADSLRRN